MTVVCVDDHPIMLQGLRETVQQLLPDASVGAFANADDAFCFAKENGCYNVTLNVWSCNESAMKFYEKCGLVPQKVGMEQIL